MKLTMAIYGFFVYPMSGDRCLGLIAPKVDGTVPHRCDLLIQGDLTSEPPAGLRPYFHRGSTPMSGSILPLADVDVQLGSGTPATAGSFHLIQPMDSLICGLSLPANYRESDAIHVGVDLAGGTIASRPDAYTARSTWSWKGCDGRDVAMRVTSYTMYETDEFDGTITLHPRNGRAATRLVFAGDDLRLALRYGLDEPRMLSEVTKSHVVASRRLCDAPTAVAREVWRKREPMELTPWPGLDARLIDFLTAIDRPEPVDFEGDPHCSARMIQVNHVGQAPVQQAGA